MFSIFLAILKFCTDQRLFWRTTLMNGRRKDSVVIILHQYVFDFSHHPRVLYRSKTVLTHYSDECLTQRFSSYYFASICFRFFSPSSSSVQIKDCSDALLWWVSDGKFLLLLCCRFLLPSSSTVLIKYCPDIMLIIKDRRPKTVLWLL